MIEHTHFFLWFVVCTLWIANCGDDTKIQALERRVQTLELRQK